MRSTSKILSPHRGGQDRETPCRLAKAGTLLCGNMQTLARGCHGVSKAVKCRMLPTAHHNFCPWAPCMPMVAGKPPLLELDRNIPYSLQPTHSAQHQLSTPAHRSGSGSPYRFTVAVHFKLSGLRMSLSRMPTIWEKRGLSLRSFCQQSSMSWCRAVGQPMGAGRR